ncbi:hypothetical protein GGS26DRAFT_553969 [Hypomontagnella submonticulosa]|nr:hypothetical protein GGS26DRAFT_553969 [Hypomontagnella submonticulosa]
MMPPGSFDPEIEIPELSMPSEPFGNRPYTPLARHYGGMPFNVGDRTPENLFEGPIHSGYAPRFPDDMNAIVAKTVTAIPKPSNAELDALFVNETNQYERFLGLRTWETPLLNDRLYGGWTISEAKDKSNWEQWEIYKKNLVHVDTDEWLHCLKKHSWFDLNTNFLNSLDDPIPGLVDASRYEPYPDKTYWSVNNDVIWEYLSIVLEVVNRIYKRMCAEQNEWLDSFLFASREYIGWDPNLRFDDRIPKDHITRFSPRAKEDRATPFELWEKLGDLTEGKIIFTFFDEASSAGKCYGSTHSGIGLINSLIKFPVQFLRPLLEKETSVPERCAGLTSMIATIVHEMAHAMNNCKYDDIIEEEPFYKDEFIKELGFSVEQEVWGGVLSSCPLVQFVRAKYRGFVSHVSRCEWPDPHKHDGIKDYENEGVDQWYKDINNKYNYQVPTFFASVLVCQKFWTTTVNRRGLRALKPPLMFRSKQPILKNHVKVVETDAPETYLDEFADHYTEIRQSWQLSHNNMSSIREDWYDKEWLLWFGMPWVQRTLREDILKFTYFHAERNIYGCRHVLSRMTKRASTHKLLDPEGSPNKASTLWQNIYLLMAASLPLLPDGSYRIEIPPRWQTLWPSHATQAGWWGNLEMNKGKAGIGPINAEGDYIQYKYIHAPNNLRFSLKVRTAILDRLKENLRTTEYKYGGPLSFMRAMLDAILHLEAQMTRMVSQSHWLDFTFRIPPYDPGWVSAHRFNDVYTTVPISLRYRAVTPPNLLGLLPPGNRDFVPATVHGYVDDAANKGPPLSPTYMYPALIADHAFPDNVWVVRPDLIGEDYYVYDITALIKDLGFTDEEFDQIARLGPYGLELVDSADERIEAIRAALGTTIEPIHRAIMLRRPEEVAEFNGQIGNRSWLTWGDAVYDVTEFPFANPAEEFAMTTAAGGPMPPQLIKSSDPQAAELLEARLGDYICGHIKMDPYPRQAQLRYFTLRMLGVHDCPSVGLYTAVHNRVYDTSPWALFHPGGMRILRNCWGGDGTNMFNEYHMIEQLDAWDHWQVGWLVPERTPDSMVFNEVGLHGWIFNIAEIEDDKPAIYDLLRPYIGKVVSNKELEDTRSRSAGPSALAWLYLSRKDLIVAGLTVDEELEEYWIPTGEFFRHTGKNQDGKGIWTTYHGHVYNITDLMLHPSYYSKKIPVNFCGREVTDDAIGQYLEQSQAARWIGRLYDGDPWFEPEPDPSSESEESVEAKHASHKSFKGRLKRKRGM